MSPRPPAEGLLEFARWRKTIIRSSACPATRPSRRSVCASGRSCASATRTASATRPRCSPSGSSRISPRRSTSSPTPSAGASTTSSWPVRRRSHEWTAASSPGLPPARHQAYKREELPGGGRQLRPRHQGRARQRAGLAHLALACGHQQQLAAAGVAAVERACELEPMNPTYLLVGRAHLRPRRACTTAPSTSTARRSSGERTTPPSPPDWTSCARRRAAARAAVCSERPSDGAGQGLRALRPSG